MSDKNLDNNEENKNTNPEDEGVVSIPKNVLNNLLSRIDALEHGNSQPLRAPKRVKEHTATIRIVDDLIVVGHDKVYHELNTAGEKVLFIDLKLLGEDGKTVKTKPMVYLDYLNNENNCAPKVTVKILEQKAKENTEYEVYKGGGGIINKVDKNDRVTDEQIYLDVTTVSYTSKVEILEGKLAGKQFVIKNDYLND